MGVSVSLDVVTTNIDGCPKLIQGDRSLSALTNEIVKCPKMKLADLIILNDFLQHLGYDSLASIYPAGMNGELYAEYTYSRHDWMTYPIVVLARTRVNNHFTTG